MKHAQRPRILYVEDDVDTREVVKLILAAAGYQMTTSDTCANALDVARADKFDLYLIDILLPAPDLNCANSFVSLTQQRRLFSVRDPLRTKTRRAPCNAEPKLTW